MKKNPPQKSNLTLYVSLCILGCILASYFLVPDVEIFLNESWDVLTSDDETRIKNWIKNFGWLGPIVLIAAMILQMFLLVIPSVLLMVVSILAYGPFWGSSIVLASVFTASTIGYIIGKYLGENFILKFLGRKTENKIKSFIDNYGVWAVFITRLNPFLSNDAVSFIGGLLKMNYWKFIGATLGGILPLTIFIAVIGRNTQSLKSGLLWGSLICLLLLGIYIFWDKKKKQ
ncbi:TVP38/TMEM64 family protein [Tamlana crocina]|uniref:TVP38/TMEM64 family membrane protein n=1 Tax=Tamlana crocina TaxID=393006 RepID=A0ABX1D6C4_9FLAO|nr:TVP38/TMEM64 family protein [Tamlana crocina]NJX13885.1 TVP38/TMEM64 family protein [Tamlana crocina]